MVYCNITFKGAKLQLILTIFWAILIIPTILFWKNSIVWLAMISIYANVVSHWTAYIAAKGTKNNNAK